MKQSSLNMKFALLAIAISGLGVLSGTGCLKSDITNIGSSGKYIVCFGDSITEGFGAGPKESYPDYLKKLTSVPVVNAGIEGDTTAGALKRIKPDVLERNPLLVVIEFGGNDFLARMPVEDTKRNLEEIIGLIQKQGAIVALADISNADLMPEYGRIYKELSRKYKTIYIPGLLDGIFDSNRYKSDDLFHPNAAGYQIIAHRVHRSILPYLNRNAILNKFHQ